MWLVGLPGGTCIDDEPLARWLAGPFGTHLALAMPGFPPLPVFTAPRFTLGGISLGPRPRKARIPWDPLEATWASPASSPLSGRWAVALLLPAWARQGPRPGPCGLARLPLAPVLPGARGEPVAPRGPVLTRVTTPWVFPLRSSSRVPWGFNLGLGFGRSRRPRCVGVQRE